MTFFLIGAMYLLLRGAGPTARVQMVFCDARVRCPNTFPRSRIRVIGAVEAAMSRNAAARRFGVSIANAVRWMDEYLRTGLSAGRPGAISARVGSRRRRSF